MAKIFVGLSGGVDSSVAAYLLKEQGHDVTGVFMINWHDSSVTLESNCSWQDDVLVAKLVARKLDIPFKIVDLSEDYRKRVVDYMFSEYENGRTPNPDVLCNREVKFDLFHDKCIEMGAEYIATGHYARVEKETVEGKNYFRLLEGLDPKKDQSYFLCQLNQNQLSKSLFPIGHLEKSEVREIARQQNLASAEKKDSQGICFVGKVDLPTFLQQKLASKEGDFILISPEYYQTHQPNSDNELKNLTWKYKYRSTDGKFLAKHKGAHFYTIGQRKGLNIGGTGLPSFVIGTDVKQNIIYIGLGKNHPGLFRKGLFIAHNETHWVRPDKQLKNGENISVMVRFRHLQALKKATLYQQTEGIYIVFDQPQRAIAAGQFAAWYIHGELIGSGVIN